LKLFGKYIFISFLIVSSSIISNNCLAQNRLVVPFVGAWNYGISSIRLSAESLFLGQRLDINLNVRCIESTDNTGYIRVAVQVRSPVVSPFNDFKNINLVPPGRSVNLQFNYTPTRPGAYNIIAEIWGGAGYTWCFDRRSAVFTVTESSTSQESPSIPRGLRMRQPYKEGNFTIFTFELEPAAVNRAANNNSVAEHYVRFMAWTVARDRWGNIDPIIMTAIAIGIAARSQELYYKAKQHRGETLQMQYRCDDTILPFIEIVRALELVISTGKILYGPFLIHHLPFVNIN